MMETKKYTNDEVRVMIHQWREDNFNPTWRYISRAVDLNYSYIISWKNSERNMGQEALTTIAEFVKKNS